MSLAVTSLSDKKHKVLRNKTHSISIKELEKPTQLIEESEISLTGLNQGHQKDYNKILDHQLN